jgi:ferredoxin-NADP reductase
MSRKMRDKPSLTCITLMFLYTESMSDYNLPLLGREEVAEDTMTFTLDTSGTDYSFRAGQHSEFVLEDPPYTDEKGNSRIFSIVSSSTNTDSITIATRMRDTAFKNSLKEIPLGTKVGVSRAMGSMTLHKDIAKPAVFLAGGVGITPMHSMIAYAIAENLPYQMYLFYANRTPALTAFLETLEAWELANERFSLVATVDDIAGGAWEHATGRINEEMISNVVGDIMKPIYYLAGPPKMAQGMWQMLTKMGVSEDNIKSEEFGGY